MVPCDRLNNSSWNPLHIVWESNDSSLNVILWKLHVLEDPGTTHHT